MPLQLIVYTTKGHSAVSNMQLLQIFVYSFSWIGTSNISILQSTSQDLPCPDSASLAQGFGQVYLPFCTGGQISTSARSPSIQSHTARCPKQPSKTQILHALILLPPRHWVNAHTHENDKFRMIRIALAGQHTRKNTHRKTMLLERRERRLNPDSVP